jgi:hypothetical protein
MLSEMVRLAAALALAGAILACGVVAARGAGDGPPPGATAVCRDGSYSFSQHHSGTCSHHGGVQQWLTGAATTTTATPAAGLGRTVLLGRRTRTAGCTRGALPDRRCTPGAYMSGLTRAVICAAGFRTGPIRHVTDAEKHQVEVEYGMAPRAYGRTIEIDHVVPLELGGSNDAANLFPEPGSGPASYHVKDRLENRLHALVCGGELALATARRAIAVNWEREYRAVFETAP